MRYLITPDKSGSYLDANGAAFRIVPLAESAKVTGPRQPITAENEAAAGAALGLTLSPAAIAAAAAEAAAAAKAQRDAVHAALGAVLGAQTDPLAIAIALKWKPSVVGAFGDNMPLAVIKLLIGSVDDEGHDAVAAMKAQMLAAFP